MDASSHTSSLHTHRGQRFTIEMPDDCTDHTIHTLEVPTAAGRSHWVTIQAIPNVQASSPQAFAEASTAESQRMLHTVTAFTSETITLGAPSSGDAAKRKGQARRRGALEGPQAQRVLLRWTAGASDEAHVQLQLFLLEGATGFVVSASFSEASWEEAGEHVERLMRSIRPAL